MKMTWNVQINKLKRAFTTNHRTITDSAQIIVRLKKGELEGFGTTLLPYSIQERNRAVEEFKTRVPMYERILQEQSNQMMNLILNENSMKKLNFVPAAIEIALHDLAAKEAGVSLSQFWGLGSVQKKESGYSISAGLSEEALLNGLESCRHFPILKIKLTHRSDLGMMKVIRNQYNGRLWVDVNGGWTPDQVHGALPILSDLGVEVLEQPLPVGQFTSLKGLKGKYPISLIADEDCTTSESISNLCPYFDGVAIKLHKNNGLQESLKTIKSAKAFNLGIMLGCRTENSIGISAIGQLLNLAQWIDLDGAVDVEEDCYSGFEFSEGHLLINQNPGIGVTRSKNGP
jgi:L-alanine-DL-glutamate epimerase-like enolase superfamily enzyme